MSTKPIPEGLRSITPQLSLENAAEAIDFYKKALGAVEHSRAVDPSGKKIWHAQLQIGDAAIFVNDTFPEMGAGTPVTGSFWLYGDDVDGRYQRALDAGMKVKYPIQDQFWGDRTGSLTDRFGVSWTFGQRMKNLTPAEMEKSQADFLAQMAKQK
jgi:PhnB protein